MNWQGKKLALSIFAATSVIFITTILTRSRHTDLSTGDSVTVVSGTGSVHAPDVERTRSGPQYRQGNGVAEQVAASPTIFQTPARQLHEAIAAEEQDQKWGAEVRRDVSSIVGQVPYISSGYTLQCGTIRCELSIKMQPGISGDNANYVKGRFYDLPDTGQDHPIQVEGVFPTEEDNGSQRGLTVIYMRDAS